MNLLCALLGHKWEQVGMDRQGVYDRCTRTCTATQTRIPPGFASYWRLQDARADLRRIIHDVKSDA